MSDLPFWFLDSIGPDDRDDIDRAVASDELSVLLHRIVDELAELRRRLDILGALDELRDQLQDDLQLAMRAPDGTA